MKEICTSSVLQYAKHPFSIHCIPSCPSTNTLLKEMAANAAPEGTVFITEHQTDGRGRLGKTFFSPKGCGLYFSLLLRPTIPAEDAVFITVAAAVAVRRTVYALTKCDAQIKWVNDLYYDNKKFCGILTESALSPNGTLSYAVLGIGINILPPENGYPEEFAYKTTNLSQMADALPDDLKNRLVAKILDNFYELYQSISQKEYLEEYRAASCVIGKEIRILTGPYAGRAVAKEINDDANLLAELPDGKTVFLSSGDVSIHL